MSTGRESRPADNEAASSKSTATDSPDHKASPRLFPAGIVRRSADEPQFNVCDNASWHGLVHIGIGTGMPAYNITPERAVALAQELTDAAAKARAAGT